MNRHSRRGHHPRGRIWNHHNPRHSYHHTPTLHHLTLTPPPSDLPPPPSAFRPSGTDLRPLATRLTTRLPHTAQHRYGQAGTDNPYARVLYTEKTVHIARVGDGRLCLFF